jgi:hypothetical protein
VVVVCVVAVVVVHVMVVAVVAEVVLVCRGMERERDEKEEWREGGRRRGGGHKPPTENRHGTTLTKRIIKENEFVHEAPHGPHVSLLTDSPTLIQIDHFRRAVRRRRLGSSGRCNDNERQQHVSPKRAAATKRWCSWWWQQR